MPNVSGIVSTPHTFLGAGQELHKKLDSEYWDNFNSTLFAIEAATLSIKWPSKCRLHFFAQGDLAGAGTLTLAMGGFARQCTTTGAATATVVCFFDTVGPNPPINVTLTSGVGITNPRIMVRLSRIPTL